jgi:hypothetical protein
MPLIDTKRICFKDVNNGTTNQKQLGKQERKSSRLRERAEWDNSKKGRHEKCEPL